MNRNKRKKKRRKSIFWIVLILTLCSLCVTCQKPNQEIYMEKIEKYQSILQTEKEWIQKNQGITGEIYLNSPVVDRVHGDVNPYFACMAARGMLCGEITQEELKSVGTYLTWHSEKIVEYDGEICNYRLKQDGLSSTGDYDSVDSYLAVFLSLVAEYDKCGGDLSAIPLCEKAVDVSIQALERISLDGLTHVSQENKTSYFMDNAEVVEACKKMSEMLRNEESSSKEWEQRDIKAKYFKDKAHEVEQGIVHKMWNEQEYRFEIGIDSLGKPIDFVSWENLYPDASSQIFSVAHDVYPKRKSTSKKMYEKLCEEIQWQELDTGDEFGWPVLAYIAVKLNDIQSAEIFLDNYMERINANREYPYHTADAAWVARTCDLLIKHYYRKSYFGWEFSTRWIVCY